MVGAPGFEPGTSASRTRRAAVLRYAPTDNESAGKRIARSPKSIRVYGTPKPTPALYALPCHKYRELRARYRPVNPRLFPGTR